MTDIDLEAVAARLAGILDRYRPELVDGTIYGIPALVWPGATGHDYFAAVKGAKSKVSLYLIIADRHPEDLAPCSARLLACRTGRATFSFPVAGRRAGRGPHRTPRPAARALPRGAHLLKPGASGTVAPAHPQRYRQPMTDTTTVDLLSRARAWAAEDPDPQTKAELEQAIADVEAGATEGDLADRFAGTLEFGTAGLRGALGAGSNRMNRVVVTRAAAGLAAYLNDTGHRGGSVVIGFDARHNSDVFARDTAEVMTGAGLKALVMPRPLPTPLLAFAIRELGCAAGVMVTASHNPPQDNGYKVYLGDGSQIVPPSDIEIAARIAAVGALADVPRGDAGTAVGEEIVDRYLDRVADLAGDGPRDLTIVYTPLHGVGGTSVIQVLETAGFSAPHVVAAAGAARPGVPDGRVPQPRGARRDGPRDGARGGEERRHRGRQRPRRRPVRRRRARPARLADAPRRRGRRAPRPPPAQPRPHRAPTPTRSSPPACWARWRRPPASRTRRR